jgi:catechol 2,3-dioxygenase-like lactoylglutathione lyase family enzyme
MHEEVVPVLRVADAARAVQWYERLGFRKEWEHQFEPGFPWFVSVARGDVRLYLSEHTGDAPPNGLVHLDVSDIDDVSAEFGVPVDEEGLAASATWKIGTETGFASQRGGVERRLG